MGRSQFTFYSSFYQAVRRIKKAADRCLAYDAIVRYALEGVTPDLDKLPDSAAIVFELCKPNLDTAKRKSEGGRRRTAKAEDSGKTEARPEEDNGKTEARPEEDNGKTEERPEEDNGKEKEIEKEEEKKKKKENECSPPGTPPQWAKVMSMYQEHIQPMPPGIVCEALRDWCAELEPELVIRAIGIAAGENVRSWKYIEAILVRCRKSGITTLAAYEAAEAEREKRKERGKNAISNSTGHPGDADKPARDWGLSYTVSG